jgi:hypothetical protein
VRWVVSRRPAPNPWQRLRSNSSSEHDEPSGRPARRVGDTRLVSDLQAQRLWGAAAEMLSALKACIEVTQEIVESRAQSAGREPPSGQGPTERPTTSGRYEPLDYLSDDETAGGDRQ